MDDLIQVIAEVLMGARYSPRRRRPPKWHRRLQRGVRVRPSPRGDGRGRGAGKRLPHIAKPARVTSSRAVALATFARRPPGPRRSTRCNASPISSLSASGFAASLSAPASALAIFCRSPLSSPPNNTKRRQSGTNVEALRRRQGDLAVTHVRDVVVAGHRHRRSRCADRQVAIAACSDGVGLCQPNDRPRSHSGNWGCGADR